jgi:hypothetical protein
MGICAKTYCKKKRLSQESSPKSSPKSSPNLVQSSVYNMPYNFIRKIVKTKAYLNNEQVVMLFYDVFYSIPKFL